jgi:hypothetical protein
MRIVDGPWLVLQLCDCFNSLWVLLAAAGHLVLSYPYYASQLATVPRRSKHMLTDPVHPLPSIEANDSSAHPKANTSAPSTFLPSQQLTHNNCAFAIYYSSLIRQVR